MSKSFFLKIQNWKRKRAPTIVDNRETAHYLNFALYEKKKKKKKKKKSIRPKVKTDMTLKLEQFLESSIIF